MNFINPTLEWYKSISAKYNLSPRCPFASSYKCPIYYQSLSLLKDTGATKLDEKEDTQLEEYWEKSKLNPILKEEMPGIARKNDEFTSLHNFCPEATFSFSASNVRLPGMARSSVLVSDITRVNLPQVIVTLF